MLIEVIWFKLPQLGAKMLIKMDAIDDQIPHICPTPPPPLGVNIDRCISICGGLIFWGGAYIRGGWLIVGGLRYLENCFIYIKLEAILFEEMRRIDLLWEIMKYTASLL